MMMMMMRGVSLRDVVKLLELPVREASHYQDQWYDHDEEEEEEKELRGGGKLPSSAHQSMNVLPSFFG